MTPCDASIKARLEEVLQSIICPVSGCWGLHGAHYGEKRCMARFSWVTRQTEQFGARRAKRV